MYRWYKDAVVCYAYLHDVLDPVDSSANGSSQTAPVAKESIASSHDKMSFCSEKSSTTQTTLPGGIEWESKPSTNDSLLLPAEQTPLLQYCSAVYDPACLERTLGHTEEVDANCVDARSSRAPSSNSSLILPGTVRDAFKRCDWFSRGWTLQEMLASRRVYFYSSTWTFLGDLNYLADVVASITRIHKPALTKQRQLRSYSVAQRFSWAAGRLTTKSEDRAYSMLGLFDINMPIIYGEGNKAFRRLQEEIIRTCPDSSIFAFDLPMYYLAHTGDRTRHKTLAAQHQGPDGIYAEQGHAFHDRATHALMSSAWRGSNTLLAETPDAFERSGNVTQVPGDQSCRFHIVGREMIFNAQRLGMLYMHEAEHVVLSCGFEGDRTKYMYLELIPFGTETKESYIVRPTGRRLNIRQLDVSAFRASSPAPCSVLLDPDGPTVPEHGRNRASTIIIHGHLEKGGGSGRLIKCINLLHASNGISWNASQGALQIPHRRASVRDSIIGHATMRISLCDSVEHTLRLQLRRNRMSDYHVCLRFEGRSIRLPQWTRFCFFTQAAEIAITWQGSGFLTAKAYPYYQPVACRSDVLMVFLGKETYVTHALRATCFAVVFPFALCALLGSFIATVNKRSWANKAGYEGRVPWAVLICGLLVSAVCAALLTTRADALASKRLVLLLSIATVVNVVAGFLTTRYQWRRHNIDWLL
jgi:hypothetical protein